MEQGPLFIRHPSREGLDALADAKERDEVANGAGIDQLFSLAVRRVPTARMVDREDAAGGFAHCHNSVGVFQAKGKGLFTEDAFSACCYRRLDNGTMESGVGGDTDNLQLFLGQHLFIVQVKGVDPPLSAKAVEM